MPPTRLPDLDRATERRLAAGLYNEVWRMMDMPARKPEQDHEMLHMAHASRYHWGRAGESVNLARGEWLCSRVYAVLRRPEAAIWHARRCLELVTKSDDSENWDVAAAYEALARAHSVAGNATEAKAWIGKARKALDTIADADDRDPIEADLRTIEA